VTTLPDTTPDEIGIIGCCLLGGLDTAAQAIDRVSSPMFFDMDCQRAFQVLESMAQSGSRIDGATFPKEWSRIHTGQPPAKIITADEKVPSALNLDYYTEPLIESCRKRRIASCAQDILSRINESEADSLIAEFERAIGGEDVRTVTTHDAKSAVKLLVDDLEYRHSLNGTRSGIETGFNTFDSMTDGLQAGEMIVIGARPSIGKTAIGLNIVHKVCLDDKIPTLVISLEMSVKALMRRMVSSFCEIQMNDLRSGRFDQGDFNKFTRFNAHVKECPLHFIDGVSGLDINRICASASRICRKHKVRVILIDYVQKIRSCRRQEKRTYEVAEVSSAIKALALQTNTAVIALAQLSRESEKDKGRMPRLSDLGESGQIERDADVVALLHRDRNPGETKAVMIVAKQRDGETGQVDLQFNGRFCRFTES